MIGKIRNNWLRRTALVALCVPVILLFFFYAFWQMVLEISDEFIQVWKGPDT